jgi:hypothetical protein
VRRVLVVALIVTLAGCGGSHHNEKLPAACSQGFGLVLHALKSAPGAVAMDGTPISHCFNLGASSDDAEIVGTNLLAAAQQLQTQAGAGKSAAATQLGYLIGAAQRGAKRNGLGDEIVRRLEVQASVPAAEQTAYKTGLQAGLAGG